MQIYSTKKMPPLLFTKINAIPQICTSGGDVYYASRNLLTKYAIFSHNFSLEWPIVMVAGWNDKWIDIFKATGTKGQIPSSKVNEIR